MRWTFGEVFGIIASYICQNFKRKLTTSEKGHSLVIKTCITFLLLFGSLLGLSNFISFVILERPVCYILCCIIINPTPLYLLLPTPTRLRYLLKWPCFACFVCSSKYFNFLYNQVFHVVCFPMGLVIVTLPSRTIILTFSSFVCQ